MSANADSFAPVERHTNGTYEVLHMRLFVFVLRTAWNGVIASGTELEFKSMRYAKSLATIGGLPEDSATSTCLL